ncbi:MAG: hypothetical protein Q9227_003593 [Pyrenula ochraceoflavens]
MVNVESLFALTDFELQELIELQQFAGKVWEHVARGETSLVVGAFMTNATLSFFENFQRKMAFMCESSDPEALLSRYSKLLQSFKQRNHEGCNMIQAAAQQVSNLRSIWDCLLQMKDKFHRPAISENPVTSDLGAEIRVTNADRPGEENAEFYSEILSGIGAYVRQAPHPTNIIRAGTPLYAQIGYFLTIENAKIDGTGCAFGLQVLSESSARYFSEKGGESIKAHCRLYALRFALEASHSITPILEDASMPCRCTRTLAFHLENFQRELSAFYCERNFSLNFQLPWVCGNQVLEMLETSFYYGLRLLSYRNYVGSVLHAYHILRAVAAFEEVPVLEAICAAFEGVIFPAGRPARNYFSCWSRFTGCRLHFNTSNKDHRTGNHHMIVPAHTAREAVGFDGVGLRKEANDSRFEYERISLFHHIKETNYVLDAGLLSSTHGKCSKRSLGASKASTTPKPSVHASQPLSDLQSRILNEFNGSFPVAKVNLFAVYLACVNIVGILTRELHVDNQHDRCICFIRDLATAADHVKAHDRAPLGCKKIIEAFRLAVQESLADKSFDDFLWKSL